MVFLRRGITALLIFSLISLVSILTSEKAHAQESSCLVTQFLITSKTCTKKQTPQEKLFPKEALMPDPASVNKEEKKETPPQNHVYFSPQNVTPSTPGTLSAELLYEMVNTHRVQIGLPPYQKDSQICAIAEGRKDEITHEMFVTGALHAGFWSDNLPFWATENMIWQHTEAEAMNWWLNSPVHRSAIEGDYSHACGTCNGEVCNMVFTSYSPKATMSAVFSSVESVIEDKPKEIEPVKPTPESIQDNLAKKLESEKNRLSTLSF